MPLVYALASSTDQQYRYIGQTGAKPQLRLKHHIHQARRTQSHFNSWILREAEANTLVLIPIIETDQADAHERQLIAHYSKGGQLFNSRRGGRHCAPGGWNKLLRPILVETDDNGTLLITCPTIPGVVTFARWPKEVIIRANEAIEIALMADFPETPYPTQRSGP